MTDPINQDTPVAWMWEDSTGCIYMCADRPDAVEMATSVSSEAIPLYSSDQIDRMRERVARLRNKVLARHLSDADLIDEQSAVDAVIDRGFVEAGGISECWNERFEEVAHEIKRRGLERQLAQHNSKPALAKLQDTSHD